MNPISGNQFASRQETADAAIGLWSPLKPFFTPGKGRVDLGQTSAHFTKTAAEFEGFSRPLFGLAPLAAGGFDFKDWDFFNEGFTNGADPNHKDYWGVAYDFDQRIVESAALGLSLRLVPEKLWDPLTPTAKDNLAAWLKHILTLKVPDNNWNFFLVLVSLGLEKVGVEHDMSVRVRALDLLETYYLEDGWYTDGDNRRLDHYIGFAMHFYGLLYAKLAPEDAARGQRFKERAALFAQQFKYWFDETGAGLAFGRSMTYRFAQNGFWAALAYADVDAVPWGEVRGIWARNMRWWNDQPYFDRDGVMSVGYAYPTLHMSEGYNSPGSPYWAMKAFLPLALGDDHPFWATPETPGKQLEGIGKSKVPGFIAYGEKDNNILLSSGNETRNFMRFGSDKYSKFAYSTHFGFAVNGDTNCFESAAFDNVLAFSDNGGTAFSRYEADDNRIGDDFLYCRWSPNRDIKVETWLIARAPWHLRIHVIEADRDFQTREGGFVIERNDIPPELMEEAEGSVLIKNGTSWSMIKDIKLDEATVSRSGKAQIALPSTALHFPRVFVPQLHADIPAGRSIFAAAIIASPNLSVMDRNRAAVPTAPTLEELFAMRDSAETVVTMRNKEKPRK